MKLATHKAYADQKGNDHRVVLLKEDNTVLKVMNTDIPSKEIAQAIADHWNTHTYTGK